ncbi:hypothetical protein FHW79_006556, partial [Azospirillum sp. OGB3]|uniref:hypothetical protein n=1 Tax=Azospirillum sp. OGB3 TaxID=2587012 RepID=UPI001606C2C4
MPPFVVTWLLVALACMSAMALKSVNGPDSDILLDPVWWSFVTIFSLIVGVVIATIAAVSAAHPLPKSQKLAGSPSPEAAVPNGYYFERWAIWFECKESGQDYYRGECGSGLPVECLNRLPSIFHILQEKRNPLNNDYLCGLLIEALRKIGLIRGQIASSSISRAKVDRSMPKWT